jgi:calcineurin-like phosphoesterase
MKNPAGTAHSDIGMTGSYAGVIGMSKSDVIARFRRRSRVEPSTATATYVSARQ